MKNEILTLLGPISAEAAERACASLKALPGVGPRAAETIIAESSTRLPAFERHCRVMLERWLDLV